MVGVDDDIVDTGMVAEVDAGVVAVVDAGVVVEVDVGVVVAVKAGAVDVDVVVVAAGVVVDD